MTHVHHAYLTDDTETEIIVAYSLSAGCSARTQCDPNDGWDAEPAEVEVLGAWRIEVGGRKGSPYSLSPSGSEEIRLRLIENHETPERDE